MKTLNRFRTAGFALVGIILLAPTRLANAHAPAFQIEEATIESIQSAIRRKEITSTRVVELYLARIKAYNGTCVNQPQGILGRITTIKNAGKINALLTLNLRPAARRAWGCHASHTRRAVAQGRPRVATRVGLTVAWLTVLTTEPWPACAHV